MLIAIMAVEALQFILVAVSITGTTPIDETIRNELMAGEGVVWLSFWLFVACYVAVDFMLFTTKTQSECGARKCNQDKQQRRQV